MSVATQTKRSVSGGKCPTADFIDCPPQNIVGFMPRGRRPEQRHGFNTFKRSARAGCFQRERAFYKIGIQTVYSADFIDKNGRCSRVAPVGVELDHSDFPAFGFTNVPLTDAGLPYLCASSTRRHHICHPFVTSQRKCYYFNSILLYRVGSTVPCVATVLPCARIREWGVDPRASEFGSVGSSPAPADRRRQLSQDAIRNRLPPSLSSTFPIKDWTLPPVVAGRETGGVRIFWNGCAPRFSSIPPLSVTTVNRRLGS